MSDWDNLTYQQQLRAQNVYQKLLYYIGSDAGVSALMGNIWVESASTFTGIIVQGEGEDTLSWCQDYTDDVNDGTISRYDFTQHGPGGGGYGLCQWTYYTRKEGMYDFCFNNNYNNIGSTDMQIDWINEEMHQNEYLHVWNALINGVPGDLYDLTVTVLTGYEKPEDQSQSARNNRYNKALEIYNNLSGHAPIPPGPIPGNIYDILFLKHFIDQNNKRRYIY